MARNRSQVRESTSDIARQITAQLRRQAEIDVGNAELADDVADSVRSFTPKPGSGHPYATGDAVASIEVEKIRRPRNGLPARRVSSTDPMFHMLEYGTKADPEGSESPFGPDTPTPAFAPFGKARAKHELGNR